MKVRSAIAVTSLVGLAGAACGQSQRVVYTQENSEFVTFGAEPTGPDVAVSGLAALVCGNTRIALYSRTTALPAPGPLDLRLLPDPTTSSTPMVPQSPFELSSPVGFVERFGDPRATYDAANDRLWMVYAEFTEPRCGGLSKLHLAVNKDPGDFPGGPGPLNSLADSHWWYYTGETKRPPNVPVPEGSFDLSLGTVLSPVFKAYKDDDDGSNQGVAGVLRLPTIAIDGTRASGRGVAVITPNAAELSCDGPGNSGIPDLLFPHLLIVPLEHEDDVGNTLSILDGDRPDESDMILLDLTSDTSVSESDRVQDFAEAPYAVQEPFEQYDNAVFLISGSSKRGGLLEDTIRLKGLFYDDTALPDREWTLQQRVNGGALEDMDLNNDPVTLSSFAFHPPPTISAATRPRTPDMTALNWGPAAEGYIFHSAVLTKDASGTIASLPFIRSSRTTRGHR